MYRNPFVDRTFSGSYAASTSLLAPHDKQPKCYFAHGSSLNQIHKPGFLIKNPEQFAMIFGTSNITEPSYSTKQLKPPKRIIQNPFLKGNLLQSEVYNEAEAQQFVNRYKYRSRGYTDYSDKNFATYNGSYSDLYRNEQQNSSKKRSRKHDQRQRKRKSRQKSSQKGSKLKQNIRDKFHEWKDDLKQIKPKIDSKIKDFKERRHQYDQYNKTKQQANEDENNKPSKINRLKQKVKETVTKPFHRDNQNYNYGNNQKFQRANDKNNRQSNNSEQLQYLGNQQQDLKYYKPRNKKKESQVKKYNYNPENQRQGSKQYKKNQKNRYQNESYNEQKLRKRQLVLSRLDRLFNRLKPKQSQPNYRANIQQHESRRQKLKNKIMKRFKWNQQGKSENYNSLGPKYYQQKQDKDQRFFTDLQQIIKSQEQKESYSQNYKQPQDFSKKKQIISKFQRFFDDQDQSQTEIKREQSNRYSSSKQFEVNILGNSQSQIQGERQNNSKQRYDQYSRQGQKSYKRQTKKAQQTPQYQQRQKQSYNSKKRQESYQRQPQGNQMRLGQQQQQQRQNNNYNSEQRQQSYGDKTIGRENYQQKQNQTYKSKQRQEPYPRQQQHQGNYEIGQKCQQQNQSYNSKRIQGSFGQKGVQQQRSKDSFTNEYSRNIQSLIAGHIASYTNKNQNYPANNQQQTKYDRSAYSNANAFSANRNDYKNQQQEFQSQFGINKYPSFGIPNTSINRMQSNPNQPQFKNQNQNQNQGQIQNQNQGPNQKQGIDPSIYTYYSPYGNPNPNNNNPKNTKQLQSPKWPRPNQDDSFSRQSRSQSDQPPRADQDRRRSSKLYSGNVPKKINYKGRIFYKLDLQDSNRNSDEEL